MCAVFGGAAVVPPVVFVVEVGEVELVVELGAAVVVVVVVVDEVDCVDPGEMLLIQEP